MLPYEIFRNTLLDDVDISFVWGFLHAYGWRHSMPKSRVGTATQFRRLRDINWKSIGLISMPHRSKYIAAFALAQQPSGVKAREVNIRKSPGQDPGIDSATTSRMHRHEVNLRMLPIKAIGGTLRNVPRGNFSKFI